MRPPLVAIALFCESLRQETAGSETIVGVMPDNANVPQLPAAIPRLCIYVRVQVDPDFDPNPVSLALRTPDDKEIDLGKIDAAVFDTSRKQAKQTGKPYGGVIIRSELRPFAVLKYGRLEAILRTSTDKIVCGHITFQPPPSTAISVSSPTARPRARRSGASGKKKTKKRATSRP